MRKTPLVRRTSLQSGVIMPARDPVRRREYQRIWANAHRVPKPPKPEKTLEERFWEKVKKTDECWLWQASLTFGGRYGGIRVGPKMVPVHRLSYEWAYGPIPDGLELDHLCRNTRCVRPDHLEPVTHRVNMQRGASVKSECRYGHGPLTTTSSGGKLCRVCRRSDNIRYRQRKKDRVSPELWRYIMVRDSLCVAAQIDPQHRCDGRETVDHVPDPNRKGMGMRRDIAAPSDRFHLIRLCNHANGDGWASAHRQEERDWIADKEGLR